MRRRLLLPFLLLAGCADDPGAFAPSAAYVPGVLNFGEVPTTSVRTMSVRVDSNGGAPLTVLGVTLDGEESIFDFEVAPELSAGLAPGQSAEIKVTYRPCSNSNVDPTACPTGPQAATLVITDNTATAGARIELTAIAVLPARASVQCPVLSDGDACGLADAELRQCGRLDFGWKAEASSCELFVAVEASPQSGTTGPLEVLEAKVMLRDLNNPNGPLVDAATLGFTIVEALPIVVPVGETARIHIVAESPPVGEWVGVPGEGGGLRLTTNDPSNPEIAVSIFASSAAPTFTVTPQPRLFRPEVGRQTQSFGLDNSGGTVVIDAIEISPAEFTWTSNDDLLGPIGRNAPRSRVDFEVNYDGPDDMPRAGHMYWISGGVRVFDLRLAAGDSSMPQSCAVTPAELEFTTVGGSARGVVTVTADGFGTCRIDQLDITSPGLNDDFTIDLAACSTLPCAPGVTLVSGETFEIPIVYANDDPSGNDLAQLEITTGDPGLPVQLVILVGDDDACIPPTPLIMVGTEMPCAGQPVEITASSSLPGGRSAGGAIVDYQWIVRFGEQVLFVPPNAETTRFTPMTGQNLIINLDIVNDCGASSVASASQMVAIAPTCP